jgi:hypothetical protein
LVYSVILFVISISGILGFRKGVLLQVVILKGMIAKIINILFFSAWGIAILMLKFDNIKDTTSAILFLLQSAGLVQPEKGFQPRRGAARATFQRRAVGNERALALRSPQPCCRSQVLLLRALPFFAV